MCGCGNRCFPVVMEPGSGFHMILSFLVKGMMRDGKESLLHNSVLVDVLRLGGFIS